MNKSSQALQSTVEYYQSEYKMWLNNRRPFQNIVDLIAIKEGSMILEVGCGVSQFLMESIPYNPSLLVGTDIDSTALYLSKTIMEEHGSKDLIVKFVKSDVEALPFRNETFDYIFCRGVLPLVNNSKSVRELSRILRTGGKIYFKVHNFKMMLYRGQKSLKDRNLKPTIYCAFALINGLINILTDRQLTLSLRKRRYQEMFQPKKKFYSLLKANNLSIIYTNWDDRNVTTPDVIAKRATI